MVEITNKKECCGCSACAEICPKQCIEMKEDHEGFLYPFVDKEKCINCGLCNKACPELNVRGKNRPLKVWAAYTPDEQIRKNSSSGGIFYTIASAIIKKGGVVFGTKYNNIWGAEFACVDTIEGLRELMVSKYVQSNVGTAYKDCKDYLKNGRQVFFIGTSCQIAGLKTFLGKEYSNLLTVDIVCHGVPSPRVWQMYLDEISGENRKEGQPRKAIDEISFRRKDPSWDNFNFYVKFNESYSSSNKQTQQEINIYNMNDSYMKAFVYNMILRPSCYSCKFKSCRSRSDITIADYWGVKKFHPEIYDDKGTSIVISCTPKGVETINHLLLCKTESMYKKAVYCNPAIIKPHEMHKNRSLFFSQYKSNSNISNWIEVCLKTSKLDLILEKVKQFYSILEKRTRFYFCR